MAGGTVGGEVLWFSASRTIALRFWTMLRVDRREGGGGSFPGAQHSDDEYTEYTERLDVLFEVEDGSGTYVWEESWYDGSNRWEERWTVDRLVADIVGG